MPDHPPPEGTRRRICQFFERTPPFSRPPLTDMARPHTFPFSHHSPPPPLRCPTLLPARRLCHSCAYQVSKLASGDGGCPDLLDRCSCDLDGSSWVAIAWYPLQRIPSGHTLKDMAACFLTYHSLAGGAQAAHIVASCSLRRIAPHRPPERSSTLPLLARLVVRHTLRFVVRTDSVEAGARLVSSTWISPPCILLRRCTA